jgi:hypothetical protein
MARDNGNAANLAGMQVIVRAHIANDLTVILASAGTLTKSKQEQQNDPLFPIAVPDADPQAALTA